jgi:hypothetical protein
MTNTFAAALLRAQPVRAPVLPLSGRAACPAFSPDVDADVCRLSDGLHSCSDSSEQTYLADVPVSCSQVHTESIHRNADAHTDPVPIANASPEFRRPEQVLDQ